MSWNSNKNSNSLRIVVLGSMVRFPLGGMVWSNLQYLMGLRRLGHEVLFLEDSGDDTHCCYDPFRAESGEDPTRGLAFARDVFERIDLPDCWAYFDAHTETWHGPRADDALALCRDADLVLNLAVANSLRPWLSDIPVRVCIDEDPAFTQVRILTDEKRRARAEGHTHYFSFGENLERGTARIPDAGYAWGATRQPVVLELYPEPQLPPPGAPVSTVMQWVSYPPLEFDGVRYGLKAESFSEFERLPQRTPIPLELALGGDRKVRRRLEECGWQLRDPLEATRDPWTYEGFIRESRAEFGVAKQGYVSSHSGWFSERSVCYLAQGRPVLHQDTGFTGWLTSEGGVLPIRNVDDAVAALELLERDYPRQHRLAREVAAEYFDYRTVLTNLLDRCA